MAKHSKHVPSAAATDGKPAQVQETGSVPAAAPAAAAIIPAVPEVSTELESPTPVVAPVAAPVLVETLKHFRIQPPAGEAREIEAASLEDAIRIFNGSGWDKVFTRKQLVVTEL